MAHSEFGGPVGTGILVIALPAIVVGMILYSSSMMSFPAMIMAPPPVPERWISLEAFGVVGAWLALIVGLHLVLPGLEKTGMPLPGTTDKRLKYKLNGLLQFIVVALLVSAGLATQTLNLAWCYHHTVELFTAIAIICLAFSLGLHLMSYRAGVVVAEHGNSGNHVYDFFMGRQLNPRIGQVDLKELCELCPGLIGWCVLNVGFAHAQYLALGSVTNSMVLVLIMQAIYVLDALFYEPAILSTMDITTDGFGFMLVFGDLGWVPFTYSLQARYLVTHPRTLSSTEAGVIVAIFLLGYTIFRGSNSQKDKYRQNPDSPQFRNIKTMPTARGRKLLIGGWWGIARHINYLGDIILAFSWCLPVGPIWKHPLAYYYGIYLTILLVHRDHRDFLTCKQKYGADWDKYCKIVRYSILPGVY